MSSIKYYPRRFRPASWLLVAILLFALLGAGCGKNDTSGGDKTGSDKPVLVLADVSWDSVQVHNRVAGFIIEHGYDYPPCDYVFGDSLPLLQGLSKGSLDIYMEVWADNYTEAWDKVLADGTVKNLGTNYPDARQGWYVPTYLIKGDPERGIKPAAPDLKSVSDLPRYWELFKDPEVPNKGRFHNSPPGWSIGDYNQDKMEVYGLDKTFTVFSSGSDTALATSMISAYEKGKPWLGYYWEPTWVMGKLDMTMLQEPPYDQTIWESNHGCAFPHPRVLIGVNSKLESKAPELIAFLKNYSTTLEQNNDITAYMHDNNGDAEVAAIYFLKKYPQVWKSWVPQDVAQKVAAALKEVK